MNCISEHTLITPLSSSNSDFYKTQQPAA